MLSAVQEVKLIARCVALDDRDAFGQLVTAYQQQVKRFLYNLTANDASLTDDLAQETFLKAWLAIRQFKGISRFRTWLFRIAYNEFLSWKRSNRPTNDLDDHTAEAVFDATTPSEARIDVETLLKHLTEKEKAVVMLYYLEEMPIKKITQITTMPEGTVKVYLSRARQKLKNVQ